jgi:hypothetical protein
MKRLLLISYFFPPEPAAGSLRPWYLAKYLPEFGWKCVIVTRCFPEISNSSADVIRAHEWFPWRQPANLSMAFTTDPDPSGPVQRPAGFPAPLLKSILFFPDRTVGWVPNAAANALSLTKGLTFDAILSSAMPPTTHVVASLVSRLRGIPWIADFRDPWIGGRYLSHGRVRLAIESGFERLVMKPAVEMTAVSQNIATTLKARHPSINVRVIQNSFDPEEWADVPHVAPNRFSIVYTGTLYDGQRSPDLIFSATAQLKRQQHPIAESIMFQFYGSDSEVVDDPARAYSISEQVSHFRAIPRSESLKIQRASAALLILLKMDVGTADELGSKILEYAAAQRPIIAVGPRESVVRSVIESNDLGWYASSEQECLEALQAAYERFKMGNFVTKGMALANTVSAKSMAGQFASVLDGVVSARSKGTRRPGII